MGDKSSLETVLDSMPVPASIIVGLDRVYVNQKFLELVGVAERDEALGSIDRHIATPEDVELVARSIFGLQSGVKDSDKYTYGIKGPNIMPRVVEASVKLIKDYDEHQPAVLEILNDVTPHVERNSALSGQLALIYHELRSPMNVATMWARVLQRMGITASDPTLVQALDKISSNIGKMGSLLEAIADLSNASFKTLQPTRVDITKIAHMALDELKEQHKEDRVSSVVQPGMEAYGDNHLLYIVVSNLVRNAWKYTGRNEGARTIDFKYEPYQDPNPNYQGLWVFSVRDNGAGFDPAKASKLFAFYSRLHPDNEFEGRGIGLNAVRRVVERHGGRIWAESEGIGRGATFYFTLPLSQR